MKYSFPALFKEDKDEPGYVIISFPDLLGIGTECETAEALDMAKEILELALEDSYRKNIVPTKKELLEEKFPDARVYIIDVEVD